MKTLHYINGLVANCPFCNGDTRPRMLQLNRGNEVPKFAVRCLDCKARGPEKDNEEEALGGWNRMG